MHLDLVIRCAQESEIPELNALIAKSAGNLSVGFYTKPQTECLIKYVFSVDSELVADQTYYVIEANGMIAACGGWSKRRTLFGGDQASTRTPGFLDPSREAAKIRAFFIHPDFARQGLGSVLMRRCEEQAMLAGFTALELMSTLPGVPFYEQKGFIAGEPLSLPLPDGLLADFLAMYKKL